MVNFWLVPNEMGFHTTRYPAYMVWIPDTWSIFRGCGGLEEPPRTALRVLEDLQGPPVPQGPRDGRRVLPHSDRPCQRCRRGRDGPDFRRIIAADNLAVSSWRAAPLLRPHVCQSQLSEQETPSMTFRGLNHAACKVISRSLQAM